MQLRHLLFAVKIPDAAQAAHHHIEIVPVYEIRQQPLALVHADIRKVCCTPANHIHAFLKCKQGFFFEIHHHADGHFIKYMGCPFDHIQMP